MNQQQSVLPESANLGADQPSSLRLISTLGLAGLISGLCLVGIYTITLPRIEANKARTLKEAVLQVLPGSVSMEELVWNGQGLIPVEQAGEASYTESIYAAYNRDGSLVGYAIPEDGAGFQDTIRLIYGYRPDSREIVGMRVLESRETPGLGDKIYKDQAFQENFRALSVSPEVVAVKHGSKNAPNQVDCITGATISSKAVVRILRQGNQTWLERIDKSASGTTENGKLPGVPGARNGEVSVPSAEPGIESRRPALPAGSQGR